MHLHLLGISGTFMSGLAILARSLGFRVTGSDMACYPPVSDLLIAEGIEWVEGYDDCELMLQADQVIVGNAMKRGMPIVETLLNTQKNYISGPAWLAEHVLSRFRVVAVSGTHGKTTTTSMLAHILHEAQLAPGFLIGGVAPNFGTNARLGSGDWFVIEADEYDSAFFDKRPKFMHYRPEIAILNNLEFDHADIYPNLEAIEQQFGYFLRTIPAKGHVVYPKHDLSLQKVLSKNTWSHVEALSVGEQGSSDWHAVLLDSEGHTFEVYHQTKKVATVHWPLIGAFNIENALAAFSASHHVGVSHEVIVRALETFSPVKRRLEVKASVSEITIYDDFAHHPTAIMKTVNALKKSQRHQRILAVIEFGSFTMKSGVHRDKMGQALVDADEVFVLSPSDFQLSTADWKSPSHVFSNTDSIVQAISQQARAGDAVLIMSNRGFDGIHEKLTKVLQA